MFLFGVVTCDDNLIPYAHSHVTTIIIIIVCYPLAISLIALDQII